MTKKIIRSFLLISFTLTIASCGKKKDPQKLDVPSVVTDAEQEANSALDSLTNSSNLVINGSSDDSSAGVLSTVYFPYNSSVLTEPAKAALQSNANFLLQNTTVQILIEGHCDEKGGIQYNLALGEKRASSVRDYLAALGVSGLRVSTVSFGKERPLDYGHDEMAWSKNRRANFVITAK